MKTRELFLSTSLVGFLASLLLTLMSSGAAQALAQGPFTWRIDHIASTTSDAGSHPDVTVQLEANQGDDEQDIESLTLGWPDGLVPSTATNEYCQLQQDPQAGTYSCSNPAVQPIGNQVVDMTVEGLSDAISVPSTIYPEAPQPGELARLVAIPDLLPVTVTTTSVRLRETSSGIEQVTEDIPTTIDLGFGPIPIHIHGLSSVITGNDGSLTIPALCNSVAFDATFASYGDDGVKGTGDEVTLADSEDFPITNCQAVPYGPSMSLSLSSNLAGSPTNLATETITDPGDAATKKMRITLPAGFRLAPTSGSACTQEQVAVKACPPDSLLGTLTVSPALGSDPLTGQIYRTEPKGTAIGIWVLIAASFGALELSGSLIQTAEGGLQMELADFPPIAGMSDVDLNLDPSTSGAFLNPFGCGTDSASSFFESHSGKAASGTHPLEIVGCAPRTPLAAELEVKLWKPVSNRYTDVRFTLTQGTATKLTKATFSAPRDLRFSYRRQHKRRALAYVEAWGRSKVERGRLYLAKRSRSTSRKGSGRTRRSRGKGSVTSITLEPKNKQLVGTRLRISKAGKGTKLTLTGIPQARELTELSVRLFGKRPRLVGTFKRCKRARTLNFDATAYGPDGRAVRASDAVTVGCS